MTGTLGGALEARGIPSSPNKLWSEVEGVIEKVDGRPLITDIRITYHVKVPKGKRREAERALAVHEAGCPAANSVKRGIALSFSGAIEEE
ncbi:MAG: OsmC family protein [Candidatus Tectomicrobia bacterium]|nr:OsmC family protein [Candidatus Tectomicrobia bacterium]